VIGGQPLAERPDFGSRQHRHAATLRQGTDADIRRAAIVARWRPVIPSCAAIHSRQVRRIASGVKPPLTSRSGDEARL
jgi:hypothetical protein